MPELNRRFCTAPMMDWSDRHCRFFWRQISQRAVFYTEMVTTGALVHAEPARFLDYNEEEHPVALQLGGSDPQELGYSARLAERWGYDEVNLNVGCPSDRVQNGMIGAVLMGHPQTVKEGVLAMRDATHLPITVKHRIGIDQQDSYEFLRDFVGTVHEGGCNTFIVHARKAILSGLSPKQNRDIPPLNYDRVYRLKRDFPHLEIIINGGITQSDVSTHLQQTDGVMVGREAWNNPMSLADVDRDVYNDATPPPTAFTVAERMLPYIEQELAKGARLNHIIKPLFNLFHQCPGARQYRRHLSENAHLPGAGIEVYTQALTRVTERTAGSPDTLCHAS